MYMHMLNIIMCKCITNVYAYVYMIYDFARCARRVPPGNARTWPVRILGAFVSNKP